MHTITAHSCSPSTIAWCSAQVHCQLVVNAQRVRSADAGAQQLQTASSTSFTPARGVNGTTIYSSKPQVLLCELALNAGETKTCE